MQTFLEIVAPPLLWRGCVHWRAAQCHSFLDRSAPPSSPMARVCALARSARQTILGANGQNDSVKLARPFPCRGVSEGVATQRIFSHLSLIFVSQPCRAKVHFGPLLLQEEWNSHGPSKVSPASRPRTKNHEEHKEHKGRIILSLCSLCSLWLAWILLPHQLSRRPRQFVNLFGPVKRRVLGGDQRQFHVRREQPQHIGNVQHSQHARKIRPYLIRFRRIEYDHLLA